MRKNVIYFLSLVSLDIPGLQLKPLYVRTYTADGRSGISSQDGYLSEEIRGQRRRSFPPVKCYHPAS